MQNLTFIPTAEKVTVDNYPYGFTLKTTLYDFMEFNPKKGYRHVTQTINPKTNRLNNPKKGTYYTFLLRYKNEDNHIKVKSIDFNTYFHNMNEPAKKVAEIWEILTDEEKEYLISNYKYNLQVACIASVQYAGTDTDTATKEFKKLLNYFYEFAIIEEKKVKGVIKKVITGYNVNTNVFLNVPQIDKEALKNATPENYSPFKVTSCQL